MVYSILANRPKRVLMLDPLCEVDRAFLNLRPDFHQLDSDPLDPLSWDPEPDLVVLALDHPEIDPRSWCQKLAVLKKNNRPPLVFTDHSYDESRELLAFQLGAEDYWVRSGSPEMVELRFQVFFQRHGHKLEDLRALMGGLLRNLPNLAVIWFDKDLEVLLCGGELMYKISSLSLDLIGKPLSKSGLLELSPQFEESCRLALQGQGSLFEANDGELELFCHFLPQPLSTGELSGLILLQNVTPQRAEGEQRILGSIGDSLSLLIAYVDYRLKFLYANRAYCDWVGRPMSDLLHKSLADILPSPLYTRLKPRFEEALAGERVQLEFTYQDPRQGRRTLLLTHTPHFSQGKSQGFLMVAQDITELQRDKERLQFFKEMVDQSVDAIAVLDREDGRFVDFNQPTCDLFGLTRSQLLQKRVYELDSKLGNLAGWESSALECKAKGSLVLETIAQSSNGSQLPVEVTSHYCEIAQKAYFVVVIRDITKRQEQEAANREKQVELSNILKAFADLYLWMTPQGQIKGYQVNNFSDLSLPPHKLIDSQIEQLFPVQAAEKIRLGLAKINQGERLVRFTYMVADLNGERHFDGRMLSVLSGQVLMITRDVTEEKQLAQHCSGLTAGLVHQASLTPLGSWFWSPESGEVQLSKPLAKRLNLPAEPQFTTLSALLGLFSPLEQERFLGHLEVLKNSTGFVEFTCLVPQGEPKTLWTQQGLRMPHGDLERYLLLVFESALPGESGEV